MVYTLFARPVGCGAHPYHYSFDYGEMAAIQMGDITLVEGDGNDCISTLRPRSYWFKSVLKAPSTEVIWRKGKVIRWEDVTALKVHGLRCQQDSIRSKWYWIVPITMAGQFSGYLLWLFNYNQYPPTILFYTHHSHHFLPSLSSSLPLLTPFATLSAHRVYHILHLIRLIFWKACSLPATLDMKFSSSFAPATGFDYTAKRAKGS